MVSFVFALFTYVGSPYDGLPYGVKAYEVTTGSQFSDVGACAFEKADYSDD